MVWFHGAQPGFEKRPYLNRKLGCVNRERLGSGLSATLSGCAAGTCIAATATISLNSHTTPAAIASSSHTTADAGDATARVGSIITDVGRTTSALAHATASHGCAGDSASAGTTDATARAA